MMTDDMFTPEELASIQRLREAPQPELKPQTFESIRQRVLSELDVPPTKPSPNPPRYAPRIFLSGITLIMVLLIVVLLSLMSLLLDKRQKDLNTPSASFTATAVPSQLSTVTATSISTQPAFQPQLTATMALQENLTVTTTAIATQEQVVLVVEGPVQKITNEGIVIFDLTIRLDPNDPIRELIKVGEFVHVEGYPEIINGVTIIIVVNIEIQNDNIAIATIVPSHSGPALPPGCKMSKNGHIKCSKKK